MTHLAFSDLASRFDLAPWTIATQDGNCAMCGDAYEQQDWVRSTGTGEFQGRECCNDPD